MIQFDWKEKISSFFEMGKRSIENGVQQIEIQKLKWKLKVQYRELGEYVLERKMTEDIIDFSFDDLYKHKINNIIKLKLYIDNYNK